MHSLLAAERKDLRMQLDRTGPGTGGSHRRGLATPTFAGHFGHLELDEELFQLVSHSGSSDKTLVIQEMLLTPL